MLHKLLLFEIAMTAKSPSTRSINIAQKFYLTKITRTADVCIRVLFKIKKYCVAYTIAIPDCNDSKVFINSFHKYNIKNLCNKNYMHC